MAEYGVRKVIRPPMAAVRIPDSGLREQMLLPLPRATQFATITEVAPRDYANCAPNDDPNRLQTAAEVKLASVLQSAGAA